jgi:hypothetical protein
MNPNQQFNSVQLFDQKWLANLPFINVFPIKASFAGDFPAMFDDRQRMLHR